MYCVVQKDWVRLRSLYLRCTCAVTHLASHVNESGSVSAGDVETVKTLLAELRQHASKCSLLDTSAFHSRLSQPPASPLTLTLATSSWSLVADSVEIALHVQHITSSEQDEGAIVTANTLVFNV